MAYLLHRLCTHGPPCPRRLAELKREWHAGAARHPRIVAGVVGAFALIASLSLVGGIWFLVGLREGLPDLDALRRIGEMDQATAVFDDSGSAGVHDLQGTADRSAAVRNLAESDRRR